MDYVLAADVTSYQQNYTTTTVSEQGGGRKLASKGTKD